MKLGFIGLGKMGYSMCLNLAEKKHEIIVSDLDQLIVKKLSKEKNIYAVDTVTALVEALPKQKIIWLMLPAGKPVAVVLKQIVPLLSKGDILIDGGNSFYKDSIQRNNMLKKKEIHYLDCGTSGGMSGARHGACMMVGGDLLVFKKVEKLFKDMCVSKGYGYVGKTGAGHFVKAIHNGIEYSMMGALAEGMQAIKEKRSDVNLAEVSKIYAHGSIIAGNLSTWLYDSYKKKGYLDSIQGTVPKGQTEDEMKYFEELGSMKLLREARLMRVKSRKKPSLAGKLIAAMRNQFGGHEIIKKKK